MNTSTIRSTITTMEEIGKNIHLKPTSPTPDHDCGVYVIKYSLMATPLIKIGMSTSISTRIKTILGQLPGDMEIIAKFPTNDPHKLEKHLHRKFKQYRYDKEWFHEECLDMVIKEARRYISKETDPQILTSAGHEAIRKEIERKERLEEIERQKRLEKRKHFNALMNEKEKELERQEEIIKNSSDYKRATFYNNIGCLFALLILPWLWTIILTLYFAIKDYSITPTKLVILAGCALWCFLVDISGKKHDIYNKKVEEARYQRRKIVHQEYDELFQQIK